MMNVGDDMMDDGYFEWWLRNLAEVSFILYNFSPLCPQGAHEALHPCSQPYPTPNPTPQSLEIQATLYFSPPHLHFEAAARRNTVAEESEASLDSRRWNG